MFPLSFSIPKSPLIGAVRESTRIRAGWESTVWYVPGTGLPSLSRSYLPAGTNQVAIAVSTIRANRMVYAEGSRKDRFFSVGSAGATVVESDTGDSCRDDRDRGCRHRAERGTDLVAVVVRAAARPPEQADDEHDRQGGDQPAHRVAHRPSSALERVPDQRTGHAVATAATLAELEALDGDHLDAGLAHLGDGVGVPLVRDDDARFHGDDVVAVVPLLALLLVRVATRLDHAQVR